MTASCVYLWILESFSEHLFYRAPLRNWLWHVQFAEFHPPDTVKTLFYRCFSTILYKNEMKPFEGVHLLKIPETIFEEVNLQWSSEMPTCKFTKKTLLQILLYVFCLHILRINHDYFFRRGFESVWTRLQKHPSYYSVFWYVLFYKNLIVLHHDGNSFLF